MKLQDSCQISLLRNETSTCLLNLFIVCSTSNDLTRSSFLDNPSPESVLNGQEVIIKWYTDGISKIILSVELQITCPPDCPLAALHHLTTPAVPPGPDPARAARQRREHRWQLLADPLLQLPGRTSECQDTEY